MYVEPGFLNNIFDSQLRFFFFEYLNSHDVLKIKCRMCSFLKNNIQFLCIPFLSILIHWIQYAYCMLISMHTHGLLTLVFFKRRCDTKITNAMELNVDGSLMGLKIQKKSLDDIVIIQKKSSIASIYI